MEQICARHELPISLKQLHAKWKTSHHMPCSSRFTLFLPYLLLQVATLYQYFNKHKSKYRRRRRRRIRIASYVYVPNFILLSFVPPSHVASLFLDGKMDLSKMRDLYGLETINKQNRELANQFIDSSFGLCVCFVFGQ